MNGERLASPLDAARVRSRTDGRGGQLSYLETHDIIRTANDIFGFGKWGHEITELRALDAVTVHNKDQKAGVCVGYVCVVRLTVEGCVPVSGVGYGDATEYRESAPVTAHELAAKEAESDALKRALKNYGDQFGLALYDKQAAKSGHIVKDSARHPSGASNAEGAGGPSQAAAPELSDKENQLLSLGEVWKKLKPEWRSDELYEWIADNRDKENYARKLATAITTYTTNIANEKAKR